MIHSRNQHVRDDVLEKTNNYPCWPVDIGTDVFSATEHRTLFINKLYAWSPHHHITTTTILLSHTQPQTPHFSSRNYTKSNITQHTTIPPFYTLPLIHSTLPLTYTTLPPLISLSTTHPTLHTTHPTLHTHTHPTLHTSHNKTHTYTHTDTQCHPHCHNYHSLLHNTMACPNHLLFQVLARENTII